jgi:PKD repeat protein
MCSFRGTARLVPFSQRLVTMILVIASEALFAGAGSVLLGSSRIGPSLSVTVLGPLSGSKGTPLGYAANASGGVPPYSYSWACDFNPISPVFLSGLQTQTCSYADLGTHNVKVLVGDSVGASALSGDLFVTITGPPAPSTGFTVAGVTVNPFNGRYGGTVGVPVTFTGSETNAASWAWDFGDGASASARSATHTYNAPGSFAVRLTVTGDEVNTSGTASATINLDIALPAVPFPSLVYTVTGATNTGPGAFEVEAGKAVTFTASETRASGYAWDFGDGTSATTRSAVKTYTVTAPRTVRLTVTGDGVNTLGSPFVDIAINVISVKFHAVIVPGVAHLDDGTTTRGTDVSVTNAGTTSMNIGFAFLPWDVGPPSRDLSLLDYGNPIAIAAGGSHSVSDVVADLGMGGQGTLVVKYSGGGQAPLVSTRVYFRPKVNPSNISYGSGLSAYIVDGAGNISPQGFVSKALSRSPGAVQTESEAQALDVTLTVTLAGSGSGTVTSNPAGINCPATCSAFFPNGTSVHLSGSAAAGSTFAGLTGCDFYPLGHCAMSMDSSKTVTARFDGSGPPPATNFTLSVTKAGTGTGTVSSVPAGISCGATCSAQFAQGTSVALTATPDPGSTFSGWGGACSGTGACAVTLSADASATATFTSAPTPPSQQGDQVLIGLRSDQRYRFVVTLYNAAGSSGDFELKATDDRGMPVFVLDGAGNRVASRRFNSLGAYQQVYLRDSDLGLVDGKRYVLKATRTSSTGTLLAFGTALDRKTNDLVQITDDSQASPAEAGTVSYRVAGVSRYDSSYGAHWRTDLRIFNRGSKTRNLYFSYSYTDGVTEHVAQVDKLPIAAGELLTYDDVVGSLLAQDKNVDLSGSTAGILRIYYPEDDESATRPLIIGSRNYDDQPTGTAGTQLALYTPAQVAGPGQKLYLSGAEDSDRYGSRIGVFVMDPGPVSFRIVAVDADGTEVGSLSTVLGGSVPHFGQISLTDASLGFRNPGTPISIRIDQVSGGRVGAYAFTIDKVTLDTNFIQALPK